MVNGTTTSISSAVSSTLSMIPYQEIGYYQIHISRKKDQLLYILAVSRGCSIGLHDRLSKVPNWVT
jgi:hypothetical protein